MERRKTALLLTAAFAMSLGVSFAAAACDTAIPPLQTEDDKTADGQDPATDGEGSAKPDTDEPDKGIADSGDTGDTDHKDDTDDKGDQGDTDDKGDTGDQGDTDDKGDTGDQGDTDDKGDTDDHDPEEEEPAENVYEHTIVFCSTQGNALSRLTEEAIGAFEEKYPGWTVQHVVAGGYDDLQGRLRAELAGGLQPDLAYCYADHIANYLPSGKIVDMEQYLVNGGAYTYTYKDNAGADQIGTVGRIGFPREEAEAFVPAYLAEGRAVNFTGYAEAGLGADSLLTLPFSKTTELLFYRPDALKALGYTDENGNAKPPETWDELWEICGKAIKMWNGCTPLGIDSESSLFITAAKQYGFGYTGSDPADHYLFNNDGAKAWLAERSADYGLGYFTTLRILGSYTSSLFLRGPENGGSIFCIGASGSAVNLWGEDFETGVAPIPGVVRDGVFHGECISQGASLVMFTGGHGVKNAAEKEIMTFQFVKELLSAEFQAKFAMESGCAPMRTDAYEDASYREFLEGAENPSLSLGRQVTAAKAAKAMMIAQDRTFIPPVFDGSATTRDLMADVLLDVLVQKKSPDEALLDAYKNCVAAV